MLSIACRLSARALRSKLLDAYLTLDAFADARPALTELKARGQRIAILSNGTPHMLEAAVQASGIAPLCDAVLSVDVVRMYKPRPEVYALVTDRFGIAPDEVAFVSSNRWDIMGAASFGFRAVWVNRTQMPQEYPHQPPVHTVSELSALPSLVLYSHALTATGSAVTGGNNCGATKRPCSSSSICRSICLMT